MHQSYATKTTTAMGTEVMIELTVKPGSQLFFVCQLCKYGGGRSGRSGHVCGGRLSEGRDIGMVPNCNNSRFTSTWYPEQRVIVMLPLDGHCKKKACDPLSGLLPSPLST